MLRGVARLSLRRGIHTSRPISSELGLSRYRFAMAAGASVIAASYLGWRISLESGRGIALDSDARPKPTTTATAVTQISSLVHSSEETISSPPPSGDASAAEFQAASDHVDEKVDGDGGPPLAEDESRDREGEGDGEEEEESSAAGGAFDPVTGKINWDCPCLGGMAHGPCGMQFREAFSCFVFSEREPKGIDCVEKFKAMQACFRENPDVYGEEIMNDDDDDDDEDEESVAAPPLPPPGPGSSEDAAFTSPSAPPPAESPSIQVGSQ